MANKPFRASKRFQAPKPNVPLIVPAPVTMVTELLDADSADVERASAFARALITARTAVDLGDYIDLLAELKCELELTPAEGPDPTYVMGIIASLALVASVMVRAAEQWGMETESGQPLLADLFDHLTATNTRM